MTLPRYGEYRESGIRWLGDVPAHWDVVPLAHICDVLQTGPFGSQLSSGAYIDGGVPVINPSHIVENQLAPDPTCAVSEVDADRLAQHRLQAGDIVVGRRGEMGRCAVIPDAAAGWLCGTGCLKVRLKPVALATFVSEYLRTSYVRESLSLESVGSTMENLNAAILGRVRIPLPPQTVQQDIVAFLDSETAKIDALIAEQEKLIALLAEKRQATISHAVTRGLDPEAPMKDSGVAWLGEVPAHWGVVQLRRVVEAFEQGWSPECESRQIEGDEWGVLKAGCVNGGVFDANEHKALPAPLKPRESLAVRDGDVLMCRASGSPRLIGSVARLVEPPPRLMLSDKIFRLKLSPDIETEFFARAVGSMPLRAQIEQSIGGAEGLANNLPQSSVKEFWLAVPPREEQSAIAAHLAADAKRVETLEQDVQCSIELLKERRSALIAAAVTGQIDVRGAANA